MKSKIKNITDMKKTGNRKIKLNEWQKKFFNLWNGSENPVIQQVPGGVTGGTSQDVDISLTDEENQIPFCDDKELMAKEITTSTNQHCRSSRKSCYSSRKGRSSCRKGRRSCRAIRRRLLCTTTGELLNSFGFKNTY
ncbi:unnamed protein product [Acanthoscelides obtectus]|uniref:Uncharacterized protein n=1 Tax=Acanthoscelides obtectus TaxID=200917 RepID=A0A9P0KG74_ACAOB|nr:unnamed protein product [Acanthoscelides obtectus]CAK1677900.1 hypothetical protein AOBTE_LOCUS31631 [Acanthoscelides obtectus]